MGTIDSLLAGGGGAGVVDMAIVAVICILATYFYMANFGLTPSSASHQSSYNHSSLHTLRSSDDGWSELSVLVVTDLDHDSKHESKKHTWQSIAKQGILRVSPDLKKASVSWDDSKDFTLSTQISAGGRAMELSDLCVFDGRLLAADDRTGVVYEIKEQKAIPWLLLNDGPGNVTKGLKAEWMTVKDKRLYVGGLGKEWTTTTGEYVNDHPMWVKAITPKGEIEHISWYDVYIKVRRAMGIEYPGYMIHEAVQWSDVHNSWFFLPRRASKEVYNEVDDESRGANVLIVGDASLSSFRVVTIGKTNNLAKGFSGFQFIPGTRDRLIIAVKSEERDGKPVASYVTVFDVEGHVILEDTPLHGAHKFEGIAFV